MRTTRLLAMLAAVVALAGCSAPAEPETRPTSVTTTTSPNSPPSPPAITRPLDASAYRDRVCDLLTKAQIVAHDMASANEILEQPDQRGRLRCLLDGPIHKSDARTSITLTYYYATDLLDAVYRQELPWLRTPQPFVPVTVAGQPALQAESNIDCELVVGLANTQGVQVSFDHLDYPPDPDPCARAMEVGEDIVRNLAG